MNIFDYLRSKNIEPKKASSSGEHKSTCPACGGKDRFVSFEDRFFCRGCSPKGGDIIDLIKLVEGVDFKTAREISGKVVFTSSGKSSKSTTQLPARPIIKIVPPPTHGWQTAASALIAQAHAELVKNENALSWLQSDRLIELNTIKRFKLGWNPVARYDRREAWGLPDEMNNKGRSMLVWLPRGLVIPCYDAKGQLIRIKIRRPDADLKEKDNKYCLVSGSSTAPAFFGISGSSHTVVESELDAILLWQETGDFVSTVSTGGVAMRPDQATVEKLSSGEVTLVSFDSDAAGQKKENLLPWREALNNFIRHPIPPEYGKDHTEATLAGMNLRAWLMAGLAGKKQSPIPPMPPGTPACILAAFESDYIDESQALVEVETHKNDSEPADEESDSIQGAIDITLLIHRGVELAALSETPEREAINQALDKFDTCDARKDYGGANRALRVLKVAVENASTALQRRISG